MADAVESMAYANEVPWHGLGEKVAGNLTPEQILKKAKLDWSVSKRPVYLEGGKLIKGEYALVRDTDDRVLSMVGSTFKPVQNIEAMSFFKKFVEAGHMTMETAGSLHGGRYIWGLANIAKGFTLPGGDKVEGYLLVSSPHVFGKSMIIQFTPIRVVCWNTLSMALGSSLKGQANAFRMPHTTEFNEDIKKKAEVALGLATDQMDEFKQAAEALSQAKAKDDEVREYFFKVLKLDEDEFQDANEKGKKNKDKKKEPQLVKKFQAALEYSPGHDLRTANGTWWGALNAVTYVADHQLGRTPDLKLKNAWLGRGARMKVRALNLALDEAGVKYDRAEKKPEREKIIVKAPQSRKALAKKTVAKGTVAVTATKKLNKALGA